MGEGTPQLLDCIPVADAEFKKGWFLTYHMGLTIRYCIREHILAKIMATKLIGWKQSAVHHHAWI